MNEKIESPDFEEIDRLIRNEIDDALERFRSADFEKRVRGRVAAGAKPTRARPFLLSIAGPAAVILLLAASALVLFDGPEPPGLGPIDPRDFAAVLGRFPSMSLPAQDPVPGPAEGVASRTARRGFESVFASIEQRKDKGKIDARVRAGVPKILPLSMKERMEILFKDKVIERVLLLWADRS